MRTITHRELRDGGLRILEAVERGETIQVTNNGRIVAVLVPPRLTPLERGQLSGTVIPAGERIRMSSLPRVKARETIAQVLDEIRSD